MYIPNPILLPGPSPAGGISIAITDELGGLSGYVLTGVSGPQMSVTVGGSPVAYPYTLQPGDILLLTRTDESSEASVLNMLAPAYDGPLPETNPDPTPTTPTGPRTLGRDADGYLLTDGWGGRDSEGHLTTDQPLTRDSDGYLQIEGA